MVFVSMRTQNIPKAAVVGACSCLRRLRTFSHRLLPADTAGHTTVKRAVLEDVDVGIAYICRRRNSYVRTVFVAFVRYGGLKASRKRSKEIAPSTPEACLFYHLESDLLLWYYNFIKYVFL